MTYIWLVVWLPFFIVPYIGKNHPNWLSYFSEGLPNHQPDMYLKLFICICVQLGNWVVVVVSCGSCGNWSTGHLGFYVKGSTAMTVGRWSRDIPDANHGAGIPTYNNWVIFGVNDSKNIPAPWSSWDLILTSTSRTGQHGLLVQKI